MKSANPKQSAWEESILKFVKKNNLVLLETGRSRNPNWKNSDGNSTDFFSNSNLVSKIYSIDNDSEQFSGFSTSEKYCRSFLSPEALDKITFLNGDSEIMIKNTNFAETLDVVLLDSANNGDVILKEFLAILPKLSKNSLIIVDDVTHPAVKGVKIIHLLNSLNIPYETREAHPCDCMYFFLDESTKEVILKKVNILSD